MKLRLLLFAECNRNCLGCCNKDWDLDALPECTDFRDYSIIMLTGGEPMLKPDIIKETLKKIRLQTSASVYLYTADVQDVKTTLELLRQLDGLTLTLHSQTDVIPFLALHDALLKNFTQEREPLYMTRSLRLNVFKGVKLPLKPMFWLIKEEIEWVPNCPLPVDEVFMKLPRA